jgi:hypothetical protein
MAYQRAKSVDGHAVLVPPGLPRCGRLDCRLTEVTACIAQGVNSSFLERVHSRIGYSWRKRHLGGTVKELSGIIVEFSCTAPKDADEDQVGYVPREQNASGNSQQSGPS